MAAYGQSFFQASGDAGAFTGNVGDIRTLDNVTVVGGTQSTNFLPGAPQETGWAGSGGGFFGGFPVFGTIGAATYATGIVSGVPIPGYQAPFINASNLGSSKFRNFPDVSSEAFDVEDIGTFPNGASGQDFGPPTRGGSGTSASAPMWAGFMALVNQKANDILNVPPIGFANPALYAIAGTPLYASTFNDINDGSINNGANFGAGGFTDDPNAPRPASGGFPAVAGYDLITGLGSPTCALINQLASPTPTTQFTCPTGTSLCGLVCCAGTCDGTGACTPPANFRITVSSSSTQSAGTNICITGTGFTPFALVPVTISGMPNQGDQILPGTQADQNGNISLTLPQIGSLTMCDQTEANGVVTVSATDGTTTTGTGKTAQAQIPACSWCGTPFDCRGIGTCLP